MSEAIPEGLDISCFDYDGKEGDVELSYYVNGENGLAAPIRLSCKDMDEGGTRAIVYLTPDEGRQVLLKLAEILGYIKRNGE